MPDRLLVDLNSNTVAYGGSVVSCRPAAVTELLYVLNSCSPRMARYAELRYGVWGYCEPEGWLACIRTYVSWARRIVKQLGVRIDLVDARGYRLVMP
jgi:DNA-binding response OmpR family regulator